MSAPSRLSILPLLLALVAPALMAETPPGAGAGLIIDTKDGSFCGIKMGDHGIDVLGKLPYPDGQELKDVQEGLKQSMKARKYFNTTVPGVTDVKLGFDRLNGTLYEIQCNSRDLRTVEGLGVGSTVAEFTKAYGNCVQTFPFQTETALLYRAGVLKLYVYTREIAPESVVSKMYIHRLAR